VRGCAWLGRPDRELAVAQTAPFCRLAAADSRRIGEEVRGAVVGWREVAAEAGLSADEIDLMDDTIAP
jgi:hypothetical protein